MTGLAALSQLRAGCIAPYLQRLRLCHLFEGHEPCRVWWCKHDGELHPGPMEGPHYYGPDDKMMRSLALL